MIDTLDHDGCLALGIAEREVMAVVDGIVQGRTFFVGRYAAIADVEVGEDELALINMWEGRAGRDLDDAHIATKHESAAVGDDACSGVETYALQALVVSPCSDTFGIGVESYDASFGTDIERLVVGTDDTFHTIALDGAIALVVAVVVVLLFVVYDESVVVSSHIYGAISCLVEGIDLESLEGE